MIPFIHNASIPVEQAGSRLGRNFCDKILALTLFIWNSIDHKKVKIYGSCCSMQLMTLSKVSTG